MKPHDDAVAELIPWYVNGTATPEERRMVEAHLPACEVCRELLHAARGLAEPGVDDGDLAGHPAATLLRERREKPDGISAEARSRLEAHLRECEACRSADLVLAGIPLSLGGGSGSRGARAAIEASGGNRIWLFLTRTVLSPGMALAYVLILAAGLAARVAYGPLAPGTSRPLQQEAPRPGGEAPPPSPPIRPQAPHPTTASTPGTATPAGIPKAGVMPSVIPPAVVAPGEILFRDAPPRETKPSLVLDQPASTGLPIHLLLATEIDEADLADPAASFEIRLTQEGRPVWSTTVKGTAFSDQGETGLLIPYFLLRAAPVTWIEIFLRKPGDPMNGKRVYAKSLGLR